MFDYTRLKFVNIFNSAYTKDRTLYVHRTNVCCKLFLGLLELEIRKRFIPNNPLFSRTTFNVELIINDGDAYTLEL